MADRRPLTRLPEPVPIDPVRRTTAGTGAVCCTETGPADTPTQAPALPPTLVELVPLTAAEVLSVLPTERMAAGEDWATIVATLRAQESGRATPTDIVVRPGGALGQVPAGLTTEHGHTVSKLPQERMATVVPGPTATDAEEISLLDPSNIECWTPVWRGGFGAWTFEMVPPIRGQLRFTFLVFRSPSDGNALRISPLYPNLDDEFGHEPHMITVRLGGERVPVICGPGGRAARTFAEVRGDAAKWMVFQSYRLAGLRPPFSE